MELNPAGRVELSKTGQLTDTRFSQVSDPLVRGKQMRRICKILRWSKTHLIQKIDQSLTLLIQRLVEDDAFNTINTLPAHLIPRVPLL